MWEPAPAMQQQQRAEVRRIPPTCMASVAPCHVPVLQCGSYAHIRAASVWQHEAQPSCAACTRGYCCTLPCSGDLIGGALRAGPGPVAELRILCPAQGSPWGISSLACELNNAPAHSARGLQPAGAAPRHASASTPWPGNLLPLRGSGRSRARSASEHRQGKGREKGFRCLPRSGGLSIPTVWLAGGAETRRAGACANLLSAPQHAVPCHAVPALRGSRRGRVCW